MTSIERNQSPNIQINLNPFLLFVMASIVIHGLGLLGFILSKRSQFKETEKTESTPINFVVIPPEESTVKPPPETNNLAVQNSVTKGDVKPELPVASNNNLVAPQPSPVTKPTTPNTPSTTVVPETPTPPKEKVPPQSKPQQIEQSPPAKQNTAAPKVTPTAKKSPGVITPTPPPKKLDSTIPPKEIEPQPIEKSPGVTATTPPPKKLDSTTPPKEIEPQPIEKLTSVKPTPSIQKPSPSEKIKPIPPIQKKPLLSESNSTSIPLPQETPSPKTETANPQSESSSVATNSTNLSPQPKPIETPAAPVKTPSSPQNTSVPETTSPPSPEAKTPVGSGSASLLAGTRSRNLAQDAEDFFFKAQVNASQQATNSSGVNARQNIDLAPYFAEIRRRVKQNWQPSAPNNNRHTTISFSIQRNGQITGLQIRQSSGSPQVDRESLEAVQKSSPFAALPANFPNSQLDIEFNFNLYLYN